MFEPHQTEMNNVLPRGEAGNRSEARLRVLVIHEHRLFREALAVAIATQHRTMRVVGCLSDVHSLFISEAPYRQEADVMLLGGPRGLADLSRQRPRLQRLYPAATVVIIGEEIQPTHVWTNEFNGRAIGRGLTQESSLNALLRGLHIVRQRPRKDSSTAAGCGESKAPRHIAGGNGNLTPREREILILRGKGLSNKEIAVALHIGVQTVKNHVHTVALKLQLHRPSGSSPRATRYSPIRSDHL